MHALPPPHSVEFLQRECAAKRVYVLPAFETPRNPDTAAAHRVAGEAVSADKRGLKALVDKRHVHQVGGPGRGEGGGAGGDCVGGGWWHGGSGQAGPQGADCP